METTQERSAVARLAGAVSRNTIRSWHQPAEIAKFFKAWLRFPILYTADREVSDTPVATFSQLFPVHASTEEQRLLGNLERHSWNVHLDEQIYIGLIIRSLNARRIFEIGTFDGETTRYMAEIAGPETQVFTLDLPPSEFDRTQQPGGVSGSGVGIKFRGTPVEQQITQLLGNSQTFDFSPYKATMDLVFVDASHDYLHSRLESRTALQLLRPGGVVLWHDYTSSWPGLVQAIRETTRGYQLVRLAATSLAIVQTKE